MLKVTVITIGKKLNAPFEALALEYTKRLGEKPRIELDWQKDEKGLFAAAHRHKEPIFLEEGGRSFDSLGFAKALEKRPDITFVIGPAEGFSKPITGERWSLSPLTFPHQFTICVLLEQVYRAKTILENHPYHK